MASKDISVQELEERSLKYISDKATDDQQETNNGELLVNKSVKDIAIASRNTIVDILSELSSPGLSVAKVINIVFKGDRLVYVGLIVITISLLLYLLDVTGS